MIVFGHYRFIKINLPSAFDTVPVPQVEEVSSESRVEQSEKMQGSSFPVASGTFQSESRVIKRALSNTAKARPKHK